MLDMHNTLFDARPVQTNDVAITTRQAAELLSCCEMTVVRLAKAGKLPSFQVGRRRRIWLSELRRVTGLVSA